jgi:hypothetical protein
MSRAKLASIINKILLSQETVSLIKESQSKKSPAYKIWVECSGNNHVLVKSILKRRTWLTTHSNYDPNE